MSYSEVFGGATLYPSQQTYLSITFSADVQLAWPVEQQIGGDVVADILDMNASAPGLNVDIPDARQVSNGIQSIFSNVGGNTITVRDDLSGTIISVGPGEAWVAYLTDNSTQAGVWRTFQLGATVAVADASALSGAGLKSISTTLNQTIPPMTENVSPVTVTDSDRAQAVVWIGGVGTIDLPSAGALGSDWCFMLRNSGTGDLTVTPPSGTIDGGSTLTMAVNESAFIITDGTNYFTIGFGQPSSSNFDFVSIAVPGSGDFTLTGVQLNRISYQFTGILTGDRKIIVPNTIQEYWVDNSTTGSFTLSIATALQVTPTTVNQQDRAILYCDSNDVVNATTDTSVTFPVQITQGGTSATTAAVALANLGGVPTSRQILAGTGIGAGLGDLTADRTVNLDVASNLNIDHSAVSLLAGTGISATGLGDITLSRTINLDAASNLNTDHSAVVLSAGTGISSSGLGDITASRTINADISNTVQLGVVERATQAEVDAGGDISRYITPNTFDLSQQLLDVANQVVVTTGTFFPGFTGFSVDPTVELRWTKYGPTVAFAYSIAILNGISGNGFGTSNANVFSWTGIASEVSPSSVATGSTQNILGQDNTTFNHASIGILNTVPDFNFLKLTGVQYGLNNWTAAGTKGYSNNSFLLYAFQP